MLPVKDCEEVLKDARVADLVRILGNMQASSVSNSEPKSQIERFTTLTSHELNAFDVALLGNTRVELIPGTH